jgi:hypothetical protein
LLATMLFCCCCIMVVWWRWWVWFGCCTAVNVGYLQRRWFDCKAQRTQCCPYFSLLF